LLTNSRITSAATKGANIAKAVKIEVSGSAGVSSARMRSKTFGIDGKISAQAMA